MQKWAAEFEDADVRVLAITTDPVDKNHSISGGMDIQFPILSDAEGTILKKLKMWNPDQKIARYGYYLLAPDLRVVSSRRGNWKPTKEIKAFFLDQISKAEASAHRNAGEGVSEEG